MAKWFYLIDGQPTGPIEPAALKQLASSGHLKPTDKVRREDMSDWYEANQVNGLFAVAHLQASPARTPQSATTPRTTIVPLPPSKTETNGASNAQPKSVGARQRPSVSDALSSSSGDDESKTISSATKIVFAICTAITIPIFAFFIWFIAFRDTWELTRAVTLTVRLDQADRLHQSDPFTAYKIYDEVLKETREHKITNEKFVKRLDIAEKSRTTLYDKVQAKILAEEAGIKRVADEQARREAADRQRLAQEEQRKRAEEAQRVADENRRAEEKRRSEAGAVYRNPPQSARVTLNVVKKIAARVEVGINYPNYSSAVGDTWGDVKM